MIFGRHFMLLVFVKSYNLVYENNITKMLPVSNNCRTSKPGSTVVHMESFTLLVETVGDVLIKQSPDPPCGAIF